MAYPHRAALGSLPVVVSLLLGLAGCGKEEGYEGKRVPVEGRVTFKPDGQPLTTGYVIFSPDAPKGNTSLHEPRGVIDARGNYKLSTSPKLGGVLPGWYKVAIVAHEPYDDSRPERIPPWIIPQRYGNRDQSGLTAEVIESPQPGRYDFQINRK